MNEFQKEVSDRIATVKSQKNMTNAASNFMIESFLPKYSYNFSCLGRPIIQYPQDIVAFQEVIWNVKPDLIIETGIAHGGSLILSASMLAMLDLVEAIQNEQSILNLAKSKRKVLGIDIDIRNHNKIEIEKHPLSSKIQMIEGSSIDKGIISQVKAIASNYKKILVCLDSNHTHSHVLEELNAYAPLVSIDSYCIVFDTIIEDLPNEMFNNRPWGPGDNPKTAVFQFLKSNPEFEIDHMIDDKILISVAPQGWLKKIK